MQRSLVSVLGGVLALFMISATQAMTPLQECAPSSVPVVCLDAKLRQANLQLNAALKAATRHIEELQKKGERPVMNAFVNSQRQFNAYRDSNCTWQAIGVPIEDKSSYIKDCQIRSTLAREQELIAFTAGEPAVSPFSPGQSAASIEQTAPSAGNRARAQVAAAQPEYVAGQSTAQIGKDSVETVTVQPSVMEPPPVTPPASRAEAAEAGGVAKPRSSGVEWMLHSWLIDGTEKPLLPGSRITVSFDPSGKVSGIGSVNRYSGEVRFDQDGRMVWPGSGFGSTKKAGPPALMKQEQAFLQTLRRMADFRAKGDELILESASGRTALTFWRQ